MGAGNSARDPRTREVARVLVVTLVLNLAVAAAKIVVGERWHVLSLVADGTHSTIDGLNNVIGLVALRFASMRADAEHPYGHRKFETFAATLIAGSLLLVGVGVAREAFARAGGGAAPEAHPATFAAAFATIAVNVGVARWERAEGLRLASPILTADAAHTKSDVFVSLGVIAALVGVALRVPAVDLVAAVAIAVVIVRAAAQILLESMRVLADGAALDPAEIERVAREVPGVVDCHKIRTRGPAGHVFVDLHVVVDASLPVAESHAIGHSVEREVRRRVAGVAEVFVHGEPSTVAGGRDSEPPPSAASR